MSKAIKLIHSAIQAQRMGQQGMQQPQQFQGASDPGMPISSYYNMQGGANQGGSLTDMLQAQPQQTGGFGDFLKQMALQRSASNVIKG